MKVEPSAEDTRLGPAPAVVCCEGSREAARANGTVLLFHGLTASSETQRPLAMALAARGYLAVALDLIGHGRRRWAANDARASSSNPRREEVFLDIVEGTAQEVPAVLDALKVTEKVALFGFSAGGYIGYRALQLEPRATVLCAVNASPAWNPPRPQSPHLHPDAFYPKALLSCVCSADEVVSPIAARDLHRVLTPRYAAAPERLKLVELPGERHMPSPDGWFHLWAEALRFFERFL